MRTWAEGVAVAKQMAARDVAIGEGLCKLRTREAFGIASNGTPTAAASWHAAPDQHPTSNPAAIPDNSFVWWTGGGKGAGHVALHLAGGRLLSPGTPATPGVWAFTTFANMWSNLQLVGWTHSIDGQTPARPAPPKPKPKPRRARIILCNLHATSRPAIVVPWLIAQCTTRDVDAVLLQECTPRHAAVLRRVPGWTLIRLRGLAGEAILVRRGLAHEAMVKADASPGWLGKHTGRQHPGRVLPSVLLSGWLRLASIHFPPGWLNGPADRQAAGKAYMATLREASRQHRDNKEARFYGGDWNAKPSEFEAGMAPVGPDSIDHARAARCKVKAFKRIGRAPGMDHAAWLYVVSELS